MAADAPIECIVFDVGRGTAASLVENVAQEMYPANQLVAFKALVERARAQACLESGFLDGLAMRIAPSLKGSPAMSSRPASQAMPATAGTHRPRPRGGRR